MKKFVIIYHAPTDAMKQMASVPPEEQKKGMEEWMKWAKKCGDKLVDLGTPLINGQQLIPNGTAKPSNKEVAGYSILEAKDMDEAKSLIKGHPHLAWNAGCSIEVHEQMPLPGM